MRTSNIPARNSHVSLSRGPKATVGNDQERFAKASLFQTTRTIVDERVRKILGLLESRATFTIRDLAVEFHLSPSYLQRLFKHQTGMSMSEWLNEQRLQKAANLLANSYLSVKEVAYSIGYEHPSSFIRAFERRFAQAPARYRKQSDSAKC